MNNSCKCARFPIYFSTEYLFTVLLLSVQYSNCTAEKVLKYLFSRCVIEIKSFNPTLSFILALYTVPTFFYVEPPLKTESRKIIFRNPSLRYKNIFILHYQ